ncbi:MAG: tetratricopeptide repeat protein [Candidatus Kaelpia imicola]|nr:tetratricopeptide repeat protein [Candidatus Kaelpia imicola]
MVNLKTKGIILFIAGTALFSSSADARRVRETGEIVAFNNVGIIGDIKETLEIWEEALKSAPDNVFIIHRIGSLYHKLGTELLKGNTDLVFKAIGNFQKARSWLKKAIAINPDHPSFHYSLGVVERDLGNFDAAEKSFKKAIALDKDNIETGYILAVTYCDQQKLEEALAQLNWIISIDPSHAPALFLRGTVKLMLLTNNKLTEIEAESGVDDLKLAIRLSPRLREELPAELVEIFIEDE